MTRVHRREVPREQLLLIVRSFGGTVAWDGEGSPHAEADEAITHQVSRCTAIASTDVYRQLTRHEGSGRWVGSQSYQHA